MTNYIFFAIIAIAAIILGSVIANIFSILAIGSASIVATVLGSIVAGYFAVDFIKEEMKDI